jgi:hypothetical protein
MNAGSDYPNGTSAHGEPLAEGGTWLLDVVAAVDHLRRGARPGLTVWDAVAEALSWTGFDEGTDGDDDPLASALARLLRHSQGAVAAHLQIALRGWVGVMADRYNDGHHWPHPIQRRLFPPALRDPDDIEEADPDEMVC